MSNRTVLNEYADLYALGPGTVIRDAQGWVWENVEGDWKHIKYGLASFLNSAAVPATVLYAPEEDTGTQA